MKESMTYTFNERRPMDEQLRQLQTQLSKLFYLLQGRVSFGVGTDGINGQNVSGQFQQFTSDSSANTEFTLGHTVGSVPLGALVLWQDKAGSLYQGPTTGTAWTSTNVYLKCSVSSVTFLVFLVKKGVTT